MANKWKCELHLKIFLGFPAITVCLDRFEHLERFNGSLLHACDGGISTFIEAFQYCLDDSESQATTELNDLFGGTFHEEDKTKKFKA